MSMLPLLASSPCFAFRGKPATGKKSWKAGKEGTTGEYLPRTGTNFVAVVPVAPPIRFLKEKPEEQESKTEGTTGKYVQVVANRIEASADTVVENARTRFMVEPSEGHEGLVHVRCCYNYKYWVPVPDSNKTGLIIGTAHQPEEDVSSPSCTLFEPIPVTGTDDSIRFIHAGTKEHVCISSADDKGCLQLRHDEEHSSGIFTVTGLPRYEALPKFIAFKGDNGKYLGTNLVVEGPLETLAEFGDLFGLVSKLFHEKPAEDLIKGKYGHLFLQFHTDDIGAPGVIFTTLANDDGTIRIKSTKPKGVWKRHSDNWVMVTDTENKDRDTLFEVVTWDGFVALRNLGNRKFCTGVDSDLKSGCLRASDDTTSQWARLKVEEPVLSREIYDIKFHLDEARIYNKQILTLDTQYVTNGTSTETNDEFSFVKKTEVVSTSESSAASNKFFNAKLNFTGSWDAKPIIVGGEITFSSQSTSSQGQRADSNIEEAKLTHRYIIPPGATVAAKFVGMRACCDVPYSYMQRDVLTTGEDVTSTHNDGIYTVANNYNFGIVFIDDIKEIRRLQAQ